MFILMKDIPFCRFSYIVYVLEKLLECSQQYQKMHILYDVACTLSRHLEASINCHKLI